MTWKEDLKREIEMNHLDLGIFTLEELYRVSYDNLCMKYRNNNTIKASIRRTLQEIRDEGYLTFFEKGEYKVNNISNNEFIRFVSNYHK